MITNEDMDPENPENTVPDEPAPKISLQLNTPSERSAMSPKEGERTHTDIIELPEISTFT